jgi:glutamine synthetase
MPLRQRQKRVVLEYIWSDAKGNFRSKTKIMPCVLWEDTIETTPIWNFDGSSTGQATAQDSEVYLRPYYKCMDPCRTLSTQKYAQLVFCDLWVADLDENGEFQFDEGLSNDMNGQSNSIREEVSNFIHTTDLDAREKNLNTVYANLNGRKLKLKPHPDNKREVARAMFHKTRVIKSDPWFGFEQEFFFYDLKSREILGWQSGTTPTEAARAPTSQGNFYCGVGNNYEVSVVRMLAEKIHKEIICVEGHLDCCGWNLEVAPGQCEFQIRGGGLNAGDNLTVFRYLSQKIVEAEGYGMSFEPAPLANKPGTWNGSGLHTNYSTLLTRKPGGYKYIKEAILNLEDNHLEHMKYYGENNVLRMTGKLETSSYEKFSWGVADRTASIRVPRQVVVDGCGYLEDRRPGANADPYDIMMKLVDTTILSNESYSEFDGIEATEVELSSGGKIKYTTPAVKYATPHTIQKGK